MARRGCNSAIQGLLARNERPAWSCWLEGLRAWVQMVASDIDKEIGQRWRFGWRSSGRRSRSGVQMSQRDETVSFDHDDDDNNNKHERAVPPCHGNAYRRPSQRSIGSDGDQGQTGRTGKIEPGANVG